MTLSDIACPSLFDILVRCCSTTGHTPHYVFSGHCLQFLFLSSFFGFGIHLFEWLKPTVKRTLAIAVGLTVLMVGYCKSFSISALRLRLGYLQGNEGIVLSRLLLLFINGLSKTFNCCVTAWYRHQIYVGFMTRIKEINDFSWGQLMYCYWYTTWRKRMKNWITMK